MKNIGKLKIQCYLEDTYIPIEGVNVEVTSSDEDFNHIGKIVEKCTNSEGNINGIELDLDDCTTEKRPYGIFNIMLTKKGYKQHCIKGIQIFEGITSIQKCHLEKGMNSDCSCSHITIPEHKHVSQSCSKCNDNLKYNIKLKEETIKNDYKEEKNKDKKKSKKKCKCKSSKKHGYRVLDSVVVPSVITVHSGSPTNTAAPNHTVNFTDYIKNVASSEIYPSWNVDAIRANVYCIVSFVLSRVYSEWYPSKGYNFDITNDTAYDQAFVFGRNTFDTVDTIVDQLFNVYIRRDNEEKPLFAEFCNGTTSKCPGWLSQWGSQHLAQVGYVPYDILTYYYGNNINLVTAHEIEGYPSSYPGSLITLWTTGKSVKTIQTQLNRIAENYPVIPKLIADGIYGPKTEASVEIFQGIFNAPKTGIVNKATWYLISRVFTGVTKIEELN